MERGYIKLYRSIDQNELLDNDNNALIVFLKLLTRVNYLSGSYVTGRNRLAMICNMNPNTLYSTLKRLEAATMIQLDSNSRSTTISICNWWKYQQDDKRSAAKSHLSDNTIIKKKKEKKNNTIGDLTNKKAAAVKVLNEATGRSFRLYPSEKRCEDTINKFTTEEIESAIKNMKKDEWHKPKMKQLAAGYILSTDLIDRFLNYESDTDREMKKYSNTRNNTSDIRSSMSRSELNRLEER